MLLQILWKDLIRQLIEAEMFQKNVALKNGFGASTEICEIAGIQAIQKKQVGSHLKQAENEFVKKEVNIFST